MVAEEAAAAEAVALAAVMALIPEESVNLTGTAAATNRKSFFQLGFIGAS